MILLNILPINEYYYIIKFFNKTINCHFYGCVSSILIYHYYFYNKKQFLAYLNTHVCFISYWIGFSYYFFSY